MGFAFSSSRTFEQLKQIDPFSSNVPTKSRVPLRFFALASRHCSSQLNILTHFLNQQQTFTSVNGGCACQCRRANEEHVATLLWKAVQTFVVNCWINVLPCLMQMMLPSTPTVYCIIYTCIRDNSKYRLSHHLYKKSLKHDILKHK